MERRDFLKVGAASIGIFFAKEFKMIPEEINFNDWEKSAILSPMQIYELEVFMRAVKDGTLNLKGVYSPGNFALPIVEQPKGKTDYVSTLPNSVTLYSKVEGEGDHGFLAHNWLSGEEFFELTVGDHAIVVNGIEESYPYEISEIRDYKTTPRGYIDLNTGKLEYSSGIIRDVYKGGPEHRITFQTCIEKYGNPKWGLRFATGRHIEYINSS